MAAHLGAGTLDAHTARGEAVRQFWRDVRHFPGWPPMLSYGRYGGASPQPHRGTGACSTTSASGCEFPSAIRVPPFEICDECRTKLGIVRHPGIVGREAHQRREPEPLLVGDPEPQMLVQHPLIAAELFGVCGSSAKHLAPPGGDIASMVHVYAAREEGRQRLVVFDAVVNALIIWSKAWRPPPTRRGSDTRPRPHVTCVSCIRSRPHGECSSRRSHRRGSNVGASTWVSLRCSATRDRVHGRPPRPAVPPVDIQVDGRCTAVLTGVDAGGRERVASALGSKGWTAAPFVQEPNCGGVAAVATGGLVFGSSSRTLRIANTRW